MQQTLKTVPGTAVYEAYGYDGANRLKVAGEYTATPPATQVDMEKVARLCTIPGISLITVWALMADPGSDNGSTDTAQ